MQIQVSIGTGSLGMVYREVDDAELSSMIERCAAQMGYTAEAVTTKLNGGSTLWLNRAEDQKIRGYDAAAAARRAEQQATERAARLAADGYRNDY